MMQQREHKRLEMKCLSERELSGRRQVKCQDCFDRQLINYTTHLMAGEYGTSQQPFSLCNAQLLLMTLTRAHLSPSVPVSHSNVTPDMVPGP